MCHICDGYGFVPTLQPILPIRLCPLCAVLSWRRKVSVLMPTTAINRHARGSHHVAFPFADLLVLLTLTVRKKLLVGLGTLACLAWLAPAWAGSYVAVYSGGAMTVKLGPRQRTVVTNYAPNASDGSYGASTTVPENSSISCSGQITAKLIWKEAYAGEPLPQSVIVVQHSSASFAVVDTDFSGKGACDDGLGNLTGTPSTSPISDIGMSHTCGYSSTVYVVKQGINPITLQCTPTASASWEQGKRI